MLESVCTSIGKLSPFSPEHIGPLIAKQLSIESGLLKARTFVEVSASTLIGFCASSILLGTGGLLNGSALESLLQLGSAAVAGSVVWTFRKEVGRSEDSTSKRIGKMNYAYLGDYPSASEAIDISDAKSPGSMEHLIALRQALTQIPLLHGADASAAASKILSRVESSYFGDLVHIDATIGLALSIHPRISHSELKLLSRNLLALTASTHDPIDHLDIKYLHSDEYLRREELRNISPSLAERFFKMRFDNPICRCDALNIARELIETMHRTRKDSTLNALSANCIEALLGVIPTIPSLDQRAEYLTRARTINGLLPDQRSLLAAMIKGVDEERIAVTNAEDWTISLPLRFPQKWNSAA